MAREDRLELPPRESKSRALPLGYSRIYKTLSIGEKVRKTQGLNKFYPKCILRRSLYDLYGGRTGIRTLVCNLQGCRTSQLCYSPIIKRCFEFGSKRCLILTPFVNNFTYLNLICTSLHFVNNIFCKI